jgi:hypothetical protein
MQVLRLVCSCLKNAPASDTWDLSSLLVNGSPVSSEPVTAVLSVIYSSMCAFEYKRDRTQGQYSLARLLEMLLFADAVGCSKQALQQLAGMLGSEVRAELEFTLTDSSILGSSSSSAGGQATAAAAAEGRDGAAASRVVTLQLDCVYGTDADDDSHWVQRWDADCIGDQQHMTAQQMQQLLQQLQQQLESLLFVGFKLDLQQLLQPALRFLRANAGYLMGHLGVFYDPSFAGAIFSQRVLAAAGGASGVELLSRSLLQQPLGRGFGFGSMFTDVTYEHVEEPQPLDTISFTATLLQKLYVFAKGARVKVVLQDNGRMLIQLLNADGSSHSSGEEAEYTFGLVVGDNHTFT